MKLLQRSAWSSVLRSYHQFRNKKCLFYQAREYSFSSSSNRSDVDSSTLENILLPHIRKRLPNILKNEWNTTFRTKDTNDPDHPKLLEIRECHLCLKGNRSKPDNLWKLGMYYNGGFHCFRCDKSGNWSQFLEACNNSKSTEFQIGEYDSAEIIDSEEVTGTQSEISTTPPIEVKELKYNLPHQSQYFQYYLNLFPKTKEYARSDYQRQLKQDRETVKTYLHDVRKLHDIVLRKYLIGFTKQAFLNDDNEFIDQLCITFPWIIPEAQIEKDQITFPPIDLTKSKSNKTSEELQRAQQSPFSLEKDQNNYYTVRMKYRSLETKGLQRILPKGGMWGFFGWHTVHPETDKAIIITEGEYDCMAVSQVIHDPVIVENNPFRHIPVVSLPNGCSSLPQELIDRLKGFEKIYLWMDNDESGQAAVEKFSQKLGLKRCWIVRPSEAMKDPPKDANDALRQDPQLIIQLLSQAKRQSHQNIEDLSKYRDVVLETLLQQQEQESSSSSSTVSDGRAKTSKALDEGTFTPSFPGLMGKIKGFRRGEVVIVSGPTGSGKTTLLSQLSLDFALAGKSTLWGSFEMKHQDLVMKMFQQYYRANPTTAIIEPSKEELNKMYDDFKALPIEFLTSSLPSSLSEFFELMSTFITEEGIEHLLIDNLQFLLHHYLLDPTTTTTNNGGKSHNVNHYHNSTAMGSKRTTSRQDSMFMMNTDRLELQDHLFEKFRKLATEKNINIIIVIHPRKAEDDQLLGLASIGGTAKATQEADIVLIIQKLQEKKYLDVKKNRYNGKVGKLRLYYDSTSNRYRLPLWEKQYPPALPSPSSSNTATITLLPASESIYQSGERIERSINNTIETKPRKQVRPTYQRAQFQPKPMKDDHYFPEKSINASRNYRKTSYVKKDKLTSSESTLSGNQIPSTDNDSHSSNNHIQDQTQSMNTSYSTSTISTSSFPATVQRRKGKKTVIKSSPMDSQHQTTDHKESEDPTEYQSYYERMASEYQTASPSTFIVPEEEEVSAHQSYYEQMAPVSLQEVVTSSFPQTVKSQRSRSKSKSKLVKPSSATPSPSTTSL